MRSGFGWAPAPARRSSGHARRVGAESPIAADLLRLCAFLAPENVWLDLVAPAGAAEVAVLRRCSLVTLTATNQTFGLHPVVQAAVRAGSMRRRWVARGI